MAMLPDVRLNETMDPAGGGVKRKPLPGAAPDPMAEQVLTESMPPMSAPQPGNPQTPRERVPDQGPGQPPAPNIPTTEYDQAGTTPTGPVRAMSAPSMPTAPTPASLQPFAPMAPPQGVQRKVVLGGPAPAAGLLGRAGGLLGGGIGVPTSGMPATPDVSALIQQLIQRRG